MDWFKGNKSRQTPYVKWEHRPGFTGLPVPIFPILPPIHWIYGWKMGTPPPWIYGNLHIPRTHHWRSVRCGTVPLRTVVACRGSERSRYAALRCAERHFDWVYHGFYTFLLGFYTFLLALEWFIGFYWVLLGLYYIPFYCRSYEQWLLNPCWLMISSGDYTS